jgi:hypothetical protein
MNTNQLIKLIPQHQLAFALKEYDDVDKRLFFLALLVQLSSTPRLGKSGDKPNKLCTIHYYHGETEFYIYEYSPESNEIQGFHVKPNDWRLYHFYSTIDEILAKNPDLSIDAQWNCTPIGDIQLDLEHRKPNRLRAYFSTIKENRLGTHTVRPYHI